MKLKLISDIHTEMHADKGNYFLNNALHSSGIDILILAGDICYADDLERIIKILSKRFTHILHVFGNHEYYTSSVELCQETVSNIKEPNYHWLTTGKTVEINGQRFLGDTMWYPDVPEVWFNRKYLSDFEYIEIEGRNLSPEWCIYQNSLFRKFLNKELQKGDIVVTHHLPTFLSVPNHFRLDRFNCYYVSDMANLILEKEPAIWMHGHTHQACDYIVGRTRVVCNPYGYPNQFEQTGYNSSLIVSTKENTDAD